tara:strand:+ start:169 stop:450 length:282 start_codon:yes stop_codon:yes gene_type:complete
MKTIKKEKAKELINKSNNKIFTAEFIKKDGTHRLINARLGVSKGIKENSRPRPYDPSKYGLICVYDMQINNYRMININTLLKLNINKTKYIIK